MGKGATFVVIYSIFILVLFGVFCYLMSSVNPPPLLLNISLSGNSARRFFDDNIFFNESLFPLAYVSPDYGLEKVIEDTNFYTNTSLRVTTLNDIDNDDNKIKRSHDVTLVHGKKNMSYDSDELHKSLIPEDDSTILIKKLKGHRRSINISEEYNGIHKKTGDIILIILDDSGQPRIEIKICSNGLLKISKSRTNENGTKIKSKANDSGLVNESGLINSIIKIMPNNSVFVNEFEGNAKRNIDLNKGLGSLESQDNKTKKYLSDNIVLTDEKHVMNDLNMLLITPVTPLNISSANITNYNNVIKLNVPFNYVSTPIRNATEGNINDLVNVTTTEGKVNLITVKI